MRRPFGLLARALRTLFASAAVVACDASAPATPSDGSAPVPSGGAATCEASTSDASTSVQARPLYAGEVVTWPVEHGGFLYWSSPAGEVLRMPSTGGQATTVMPAGPLRSVVVDETGIYWGNPTAAGTEILHANHDGSGITTFLPADGTQRTVAYANGKEVWWTGESAGGTLSVAFARIGDGPGRAPVVKQKLQKPTYPSVSLVAAGLHLRGAFAWKRTESSPSSGSGGARAFYVATSDGPVREIVPGGRDPAIHTETMTTTGGDVLWLEWEPGRVVRIMTMPVAGEAPPAAVAVLSGTDYVNDLVADDAAVFPLGEGLVWKLPRGTCTMTALGTRPGTVGAWDEREPRRGHTQDTRNLFFATTKGIYVQAK